MRNGRGRALGPRSRRFRCIARGLTRRLAPFPRSGRLGGSRRVLMLLERSVRARFGEGADPSRLVTRRSGCRRVAGFSHTAFAACAAAAMAAAATSAAPAALPTLAAIAARRRALLAPDTGLDRGGARSRRSGLGGARTRIAFARASLVIPIVLAMVTIPIAPVTAPSLGAAPLTMAALTAFGAARLTRILSASLAMPLATVGRAMGPRSRGCN